MGEGHSFFFYLGIEGERKWPVDNVGHCSNKTIGLHKVHPRYWHVINQPVIFAPSKNFQYDNGLSLFPMILYLLWGASLPVNLCIRWKKGGKPVGCKSGGNHCANSDYYLSHSPSPRFLKHAVCRSKPFIVSKSTSGKNKVGNGWRIRRKSINATEKGYGKLRELSIIQMLGGGGLVECGWWG